MDKLFLKGGITIIGSIRTILNNLYKRNFKTTKNRSIEECLQRYDLDQELEEHVLRVSRYTEILADLMCVNKSKIKKMKKGALLHDIGKKKIDLDMLNKHSKYGLESLKDEDRDEIIENMILLHHERWDGKGYPFGLVGNDIPIEARILSVIDYYDALTRKSAYEGRVSHVEALEIIKDESRKRFDPDIVAIFELFEKKFKELL